MHKKIIDVVAMLCLAVAIVSGFMLHVDVHHKYIYDNNILWAIHETVGIGFALAVIIHCMQHKYWFKNYIKIPVTKKRITTILLGVALILLITGVALMCGSQSEDISIIHYVAGIIATILAIGHVAKRWKQFKSLFA